jgi:hypothetical protein
MQLKHLAVLMNLDFAAAPGRENPLGAGNRVAAGWQHHYRPAGIWKAHRPAATLRRTNDAPAFGYDILRGLAAHEIVGYPQL